MKVSMKVSECNCLHCIHYKEDKCELDLLIKDKHDPATHYCLHVFDELVDVEKEAT